MFVNKSESLLGISLCEGCIAIAHLTGSVAQPVLVAYAVESLDADANEAKKADKLKSLLEAVDSKITKAAIALPASQVISKTFSLPALLNQVELEEQINIEVIHSIPYSLEEIYVDFAVLGKSTLQPKENDVLMVACKRALVDDYVTLLANLGISLEIVDVDDYALNRWADDLSVCQLDGLPCSVKTVNERRSLRIALGLSVRGLH